MRSLVLAVVIATLSTTAFAQEAPAGKPAEMPALAVEAMPAPAPAPAAGAVPHASAADPLPMPRDEMEQGHDYTTAAIAAGAVAGVIVANAATGGIMTPVLTAGALEGGMMGGGYLAMTSQALVSAIGAVGGGYVGNWLYGQQTAGR
ncbi:hypothetical protein [Azospirillum sp. SYSU D00513]|uniref:hypothetical protein n=1 Tax=Azospirillum sp. SYSU D00513 TaxID=2812561 RepID=UPI001A972F31|nr:hypothetical protein [Azospirillum sp. SYSU D00513]